MKPSQTKPNARERGGESDEKRRLLREMFLNASLIAVMKETVSEAAQLESLEAELARLEDESLPLSAPAA